RRGSDRKLRGMPAGQARRQGAYGKEYYFDVPASAPLARFIQISPDLIFPPEAKWTYVANNTHFQWVLAAIDSARAAGIRWGSVIAIVGTGGRGFSSVGLTTDADRQYFATAMGSNTPGYGWGYLRVTITATQLTARTAFSGTWQDSFSIGG